MVSYDAFNDATTAAVYCPDPWDALSSEWVARKADQKTTRRRPKTLHVFSHLVAQWKVWTNSSEDDGWTGHK